jgi:hypothetical protein
MGTFYVVRNQLHYTQFVMKVVAQNCWRRGVNIEHGVTANVANEDFLDFRLLYLFKYRINLRDVRKWIKSQN